MKALEWIWGAVRLMFSSAWDLFTLASPKPDDAECGVNLGGQGR